MTTQKFKKEDIILAFDKLIKDNELYLKDLRQKQLNYVKLNFLDEIVLLFEILFQKDSKDYNPDYSYDIADLAHNIENFKKLREFFLLAESKTVDLDFAQFKTLYPHLNK